MTFLADKIYSRSSEKACYSVWVMNFPNLRNLISVDCLKLGRTETLEKGFEIYFFVLS